MLVWQVDAAAGARRAAADLGAVGAVAAEEVPLLAVQAEPMLVTVLLEVLLAVMEQQTVEAVVVVQQQVHPAMAVLVASSCVGSPQQQQD